MEDRSPLEEVCMSCDVAAAEFDPHDEFVEGTINAAKPRTQKIDTLAAYHWLPNRGRLIHRVVGHEPLSLISDTTSDHDLKNLSHEAMQHHRDTSHTWQSTVVRAVPERCAFCKSLTNSKKTFHIFQKKEQSTN